MASSDHPKTCACVFCCCTAIADERGWVQGETASTPEELDEFHLAAIRRSIERDGLDQALETFARLVTKVIVERTEKRRDVEQFLDAIGAVDPPEGAGLIARYRRKPTEIRAVQWDGTSTAHRAIRGLGANTVGGLTVPMRMAAGPDGASGWVDVPVGTWVAFDGVNDYWPIAAEQFIATYEEVS